MDETRERILERIRMRRTLPTPAKRAEIRKAAGLTLQDLADAIGVTPATIHYWEQGTRNPRPEHIAAYRAALDAMASAEHDIAA